MQTGRRTECLSLGRQTDRSRQVSALLDRQMHSGPELETADLALPMNTHLGNWWTKLEDENDCTAILNTTVGHGVSILESGALEDNGDASVSLLCGDLGLDIGNCLFRAHAAGSEIGGVKEANWKRFSRGGLIMPEQNSLSGEGFGRDLHRHFARKTL